MGRTRSFNQADVVAIAANTFLCTGYEATSIDDLVDATGVHRGSLYKAFGSKRGLFLLALEQVFEGAGSTSDMAALDLALVALLELAPRDAAVRDRVTTFVSTLPDDPVHVLGTRLLLRAGIAVLPTRSQDGRRSNERPSR
ncbi:MAG: TetR/AcrR family transcriptional regulator [Chloroflexia bacterium]|nr:TetR/AcrR family transcriptional regulator [Chloroflexia bacterium]